MFKACPSFSLFLFFTWMWYFPSKIKRYKEAQRSLLLESTLSYKKTKQNNKTHTHTHTKNLKLNFKHFFNAVKRRVADYLALPQNSHTFSIFKWKRSTNSNKFGAQFCWIFYLLGLIKNVFVIDHRLLFPS